MADGREGLFSGGGSQVNPVKIGKTTTLLGDPKTRPEKPHTIILFPGGSVEVARTSDGRYWVHVAVRELINTAAGRIVHARIDFDGRYGDDANRLLRDEIVRGDVNHIAFLVEPGHA